MSPARPHHHGGDAATVAGAIQGRRGTEAEPHGPARGAGRVCREQSCIRDDDRTLGFWVQLAFHCDSLIGH